MSYDNEISTAPLFRAIPGTDGRYYVNDGGNVFRRKTKRVHTKDGWKKVVSFSPLTPCRGIRGLLYVNLCTEGKARKEYLHRVLAKTMLPNPKRKPFVSFKDKNPLNLQKDNLVWTGFRFEN